MPVAVNIYCEVAHMAMQVRTEVRLADVAEKLAITVTIDGQTFTKPYDVARFLYREGIRVA